MPVKVKADLKAVKTLTEDVKKRFKDDLSTGNGGYEIIRVIFDFIRGGNSPVNGVGRFQRYSKGYKEAIQKGRVKKDTGTKVSMFLTGIMLGSLEFVERGKKLFLEFKDKKAAYHQFGDGNLPVRKLLPQKGEIFTKRITQLILKALRKAARKK